MDQELWKTEEPPLDGSWIYAVDKDGVITEVSWNVAWLRWVTANGGTYTSAIVAWSPS